MEDQNATTVAEAPADPNHIDTPAPEVPAAAPPEPTPEDAKKAEHERKRLKAIDKAGRRIAVQQVKVAQLETIVAGKKADLDKSRDEFNQAAKLLTEEYEELAKLSVGKFPDRLFTDTSDATPDADNHAQPAADDAWRSLPVSELGLTQKMTEKLVAGLETQGVTVTNMGQLMDWRSANEHRQWSDLKGIGATLSEKIDDACADFWAKHPQPAAAEEPKDEAPPLADHADKAANDAMEQLSRKVSERYELVGVPAVCINDETTNMRLFDRVMARLLDLNPETPDGMAALSSKVDGADAAQLLAWRDQAEALPDAAFVDLAHAESIQLAEPQAA